MLRPQNVDIRADSHNSDQLPLPLDSELIIILSGGPGGRVVKAANL